MIEKTYKFIDKQIESKNFFLKLMSSQIDDWSTELQALDRRTDEDHLTLNEVEIFDRFRDYQKKKLKFIEYFEKIKEADPDKFAYLKPEAQKAWLALNLAVKRVQDQQAAAAA